MFFLSQHNSAIDKIIRQIEESTLLVEQPGLILFKAIAGRKTASVLTIAKQENKLTAQ